MHAVSKNEAGREMVSAYGVATQGADVVFYVSRKTPMGRHTTMAARRLAHRFSTINTMRPDGFGRQLLGCDDGG